MSALLLLLSVILFVLSAFGVHVGTHPYELAFFGLAFFAASFLVGPIMALRGQA